MSPFDILLVGHLIGDYLFQTSWMAMHKANRWGPLIVHSLVYTLVVSVVSWLGFGGLSCWGVVLIFCSHLVLDRRTFVFWWMRMIMRMKDKEQTWLTIMVDQVFHLIILAIALQI